MMIDNIDDNCYDTMTYVRSLSIVIQCRFFHMGNKRIGVIPLARYVVKLIHWELGGMYDLNLERKNKQTNRQLEGPE